MTARGAAVKRRDVEPGPGTQVDGAQADRSAAGRPARRSRSTSAISPSPPRGWRCRDRCTAPMARHACSAARGHDRLGFPTADVSPDGAVLVLPAVDEFVCWWMAPYRPIVRGSSRPLKASIGQLMVETGLVRPGPRPAGLPKIMSTLAEYAL